MSVLVPRNRDVFLLGTNYIRELLIILFLLLCVHPCLHLNLENNQVFQISDQAVKSADHGQRLTHAMDRGGCSGGLGAATYTSSVYLEQRMTWEDNATEKKKKKLLHLTLVCFAWDKRRWRIIPARFASTFSFTKHSRVPTPPCCSQHFCSVMSRGLFFVPPPRSTLWALEIVSLCYICHLSK